jgi:hypothetical protein
VSRDGEMAVIDRDIWLVAGGVPNWNGLKMTDPMTRAPGVQFPCR